MPRCNPENERIKRLYFRYLREARGRTEKTLSKVAADLHRYEEFTARKNFKTFRSRDAEAFKRALCEEVNKRTGKPLSRSTVLHVTRSVREFFRWLPTQQCYKRLSAGDADYLNLSARDTRIARAPKEKAVPTLEQIHHVLECAPATTDVERRDRALLAFTLLTGARDGAVASFKLKHLNLVGKRLDQDAREVSTKAAKSFTTWFFPVGHMVEAIVVEWVHFLIKEARFGPDDPLFPATNVGLVEQRFCVTGISRKHWANATPIRKTFKTAFERAGLSYFNPHSFRATLVLLGQRLCQTPEEFKVWSQNLGHESPLTTLTSYGQVSGPRQVAVMEKLRRRREAGPANTIDAEALMQFVAHQIRPQEVDV